MLSGAVGGGSSASSYLVSGSSVMSRNDRLVYSAICIRFSIEASTIEIIVSGNWRPRGTTRSETPPLTERPVARSIMWSQPGHLAVRQSS